MGKTVERTEASKGDAATRQAGGGWKLEDAKARFSEVVRLARSEGPQRVTVRGRDAVVVISVEELDKLKPRAPVVPFVQFMEGLHLGGIDLNRESDQGRDVEL
jgi:prevent-host-death family protein